MPATPPYFRVRKAAGNKSRYSWEPSPSLAAAGWPTVPLGLSGQRTQAEAEALAARINGMVAQWRAGTLDRVPDVILDLKLVARPGKPEGKRLMRAPAAHGTCGHLIQSYLGSRKYKRLADNTRESYRQDCEFLLEWCGDMPLASITPKMVKRLYETLFDGVPATKTTPAKAGVPRRAQKIVIMGRTVWKWGQSEDMVVGNPFMIKTESVPPQIPELWTDEAIRVFVQTADEMGLHGVGTAVILNSWLGQRVADLRQLDYRMIRNGEITITQQKTGERVVLPLGMVPALVDRLKLDDPDVVTRITKLVHDPDGMPYSVWSLRTAFGRVRDEAAKRLPLIAKLDMMHLRHTAITRLAEAGSTPQEIRAVSGHTLASVETILQRYNLRTKKQASNAFQRRLTAEGGGEI